MGFINTGKNLNEVPEEAPVPNGEYDLRVFSVRETKSGEGRTVVRVGIAVEDPNFPNAQPLNHNLTIPKEEDWTEDLQLAQRLMRDVKRFLHLFGIEWTDTGFDTEDLLEATASGVPLNQREDNRPGYEGIFYNNIRLPRIRD